MKNSCLVPGYQVKSLCSLSPQREYQRAVLLRPVTAAQWPSTTVMLNQLNILPPTHIYRKMWTKSVPPASSPPSLLQLWNIVEKKKPYNNAIVISLAAILDNFWLPYLINSKVYFWFERIFPWLIQWTTMFTVWMLITCPASFCRHWCQNAVFK